MCSDNKTSSFSALQNLEYVVELDKGKESDALRRMFFWDAANKKKLFMKKDTYTIPTQNKFYPLPTVTVYLLVWKSSLRKK